MKTWMIGITILVICLLVFSGWFLYSEDLNRDEDDIENEGTNPKFQYPRVDGSTSTHPLEVLIACKRFDINYTWLRNPYFDDAYTVYPFSNDPEKEYIVENISDNIVHHGTHGAYVNLIENRTDLILVARSPSKDELDLAKEMGVELEIKPVALDAFVFIVNINNPVNNLTVEQIQNIYTGNITNWTEVGGNNGNITPYLRNNNSGSHELMKSLVMKDLDIIGVPEIWILGGMMGPINKMHYDPSGICYSVYFYKEFMAPARSIKMIGVNGVYPNSVSIGSKEYVFTTEVYSVIRSDLPEDSEAYQLRDWILSKEGQDVVKESGYVPIS
jgi:phosphate transport system substrate-binding protein